MKYFTKEVKIALTAIVAIVILFYGLNFLKGINLFSSKNAYYVEFSNISGLTKSSPVYADGYNIGIVRNIVYDYKRTGHVIVEIEVDKDMRIPRGSSAELVTEMLGTTKLNLLLNNNPRERCEPGDTIPGGIHAGALDKASDMIPQFQQMLPKIDSILTSVNMLLKDPALANTLHNAEATTANLNQSSQQLTILMNTLNREVPALTGKLGRVCDNAEVMTYKLSTLDFAGTMANVNHTITQVDTTLFHIQSLTDRFRRKDNTIGLLLNDPSLYNNLNQTSVNAAALMKDLKEHPKRYVHFSVFGRKDK